VSDHSRAGSQPGFLSNALALAIVFGLLFVTSRIAPAFRDDLGVIAVVGFLLLGGALMAEVISPLRVPHLTGYLACGIIAGPHVLKLIQHGSVETMGKVNSLALGLIALAGGAELRLENLRRGFASLAWETSIQSVAGVVLMGAVFFLARPLLPFPPAIETRAMLGLALLWGVMSITRSPSATLGILSQTRAQGPLANHSLAFVMTSDVVVVILLAGAMTVARPLLLPDATFSGAAFLRLGHELLGSVSLGTALGLILAAYVRLVGKQLAVVLIALGFGAWEVLGYLRFDPLLTFMVAGFVVQNLSKQGDKFLHEIEQTGGIVYVIFFATAGAHLDVPQLERFWPVTLLLCAARASITVVCSRVAARLAKDPPAIKTWGWTPLISQAGLALGLAAVVERTFPAYGAGFASLAVAAVAVNEMVGPVLFKLAVDRVGEAQPPSTVLVGDGGPGSLPLVLAEEGNSMGR
jgi:Kef-type K+ transport system membrane component KefB